MARMTSRRALVLGAGTASLATAGLMLTAGTAAQALPKRPKKQAAPNPSVSPIDRAFVRLAEGPVHYRYLDGRARRPELPLMLLHASPGSSERLEPLMSGLASNRCVICAGHAWQRATRHHLRRGRPRSLTTSTPTFVCSTASRSSRPISMACIPAPRSPPSWR